MTERKIKRGEIWWISLDPTQGSEIKKTRPCIILTNNTLNRIRRTVVVIPISSSAQSHPPITIPITCRGQSAVAIIDQVRAVTKHRLRSKIEKISNDELIKVCNALSSILVL